MNTIVSYVPVDRRFALAAGVDLAGRADGAALFADISGFTPATELIARVFGPQRGAEELLQILNPIFAVLTAECDRYGGSVIGFSGDALTVWFDAGDAPARGAALRAAACALAMQAAIRPLTRIALPGAAELRLALKTTVAAGPVRRILVGDRATQVVEVLAGATVARLGAAAGATLSDEVLLDPAASRLLAGDVVAAGARALGAESCLLVRDLAAPVPPSPWPALPADALDPEQVRPWLLPPIYARLRRGQDDFLTELRHTVSLFLRFRNLDYDRDDDAPARLDAFIRWLQGVVARYAGCLTQVTIGDKGSYLYVVFGAPVAHGDDAARAVAAALDLRALPDALAGMGPVQIGISAGQSRAGAMGGSTRLYTVMGDATNLAARLMEAAEAGQVLMSAGLAPVVGRRFRLDPRPPLKVKGKDAPVSVVAVSPTSEEGAVQLQEPQYTLPLVGRAAEMDQIAERIALARAGQGQVLSIVGAAGIGKSRLVAEAMRAAALAGFSVVVGSGQATGTQMAYYAWQPLWRAFFGLAPAAGPAALGAALAALDPDLLPRLPLLGPAVGLSLPDSGLTAGMEARQRKEGLEQLLAGCLRARLAGRGRPAAPLLMVMEDAHWLDVVSIDLLGSLARAAAGLPLLLIVAHRGAESGSAAPLPIVGLPYHAEIRLGELGPEAAARLVEEKVAQALGGRRSLPAPFVQAILSRAEGNPFYIEELLNFLRDRGIAPGDMAELAGLELPTSLTSLILSRIDNLTSEQQITLKVASVIGRSFRLDWLWGVYPGLGAQERVRRDLEHLAGLDITPLDTPEPDLTYLFKHITTQEVAYTSLPFAQRAQLHEQFAAWLEAGPPAGAAPSLDLLAYHYGRGNNLSKQREYFRKAGDAAAAQYANTTALRYYERLLGLLEPAEQPLVLLQMGRLHELLSDWAASEARYSAVIDGAVGPQAASLRAQAQAGLGGALCGTGRYAEAQTLLRAAYDTFAALGDRARMSQSLLELARSYWYQGQLGETEAAIRRALDLEGEQGDQARLARAYQLLGTVDNARQEFAQARVWFLRSLAAQRTLGNRPAIAAATVNLAMIALMGGHLDESREMALEASTIFYELGMRWEYALSRMVLGLAMAARGEAARAIAVQHEALAIVDDLQAVSVFDSVLTSLAHTIQLASPESVAVQSDAVRLVAAGTRIVETINRQRIPLFQSIADGVLARARARLAPELFAQAWAEGSAMDARQAVAYGLGLA